MGQQCLSFRVADTCEHEEGEQAVAVSNGASDQLQQTTAAAPVAAAAEAEAAVIAVVVAEAAAAATAAVAVSFCHSF